MFIVRSSCHPPCFHQMFAGATYALSQAAAAKPLMAFFEKNHTPLLCSCLLALACGRTVAALALSLPGMFAGTFVVIMSLGVINTVLSAAVRKSYMFDMFFFFFFFFFEIQADVLVRLFYAV